MKTLKGIGYGVLAILAFALMYSVMFGLSWIGIQTGGVLKSAQVEVDRKVFEQSIPYQRGQRDEFERLKYQWETTDNVAVCNALQSRFRSDRTGLTPGQTYYLDALRCN